LGFSYILLVTGLLFLPFDATLFLTHGVLALVDVSNGNMQPLYLIVLMVMFGLASLPNMYALQYLFTGAATGYVVTAFYNLLTGE